MIKRSKNSRQRGSQSHGWGIGKAHHKGAGSRGGRGMAGTGKRADQKKPSVWNNKDKKSNYFGKHGFNPGSSKPKGDSINLNDLDLRIDNLVKKGKSSLKGDIYEIDLSKLSYGKLLGVGNTSKKINIKVKSFSKKAEEKIKTAGGSINTSDNPPAKEKVEKKK